MKRQYTINHNLYKVGDDIMFFIDNGMTTKKALLAYSENLKVASMLFKELSEVLLDEDELYGGSCFLGVGTSQSHPALELEDIQADDEE
jgi:hypothetical protein